MAVKTGCCLKQVIHKVLIRLVVIASLIQCTKTANSYMLVFPNTVRPGLKFETQLTLLKKFENMTVVVSLNNEKETVVKDDVTIPAGKIYKPVVLTLQLPHDLPNAKYTLEVEAEGNSGVHFINSTSMKYIGKGLSIFIQTDKAIYKPGQAVLFRALAVKPDLSTVFGLKDIGIYDKDDNRIAQWLGVDGPGGVFQGSLQLSEHPPLGDWRIEVDFKGVTKRMTFTVAEYVLPKFEVSLTVPSFGVITDTYLSVTVGARYTFGKGVRGNGTLNIKQKWSSSKDPELNRQFQINGEYKFQIKVSELKSLFGSLSHRTLKLFAEVEEGITGNAMDDTEEITYYSTEEKLVIMDGPDNFKPGLQYTSFLYLSDQDDKPLSSQNSKVDVTVTMYANKQIIKPGPAPLLVDADKPLPKMIMPLFPPPSDKPSKAMVIGPKTINVPGNGIVTCTFDVPLNITRITIKGEYKTLQTTKQLKQFHSTSNTYIQGLVITKNPKVGKYVKFEIRSTVAKIRVYYVITSKGMLVKTGAIFMKKTTTTIKYKLPSDAAPSSKCVVYWVTKYGEIIADSIDFNVEGIFANKVSISYSSKKPVEPGSDVTIKVKASAGSLCSILTVDKSVLLLKSGNDITEDKVRDELQSYDPSPSTSCGFFPCLRWYFPLPVSGVDAHDMFRESGLDVLTDAFLYDYKEFPWLFRGRALEMALPAMVMDGESAPSPPGSGPRIRQKFPETWVYDSVFVSGSGKASIKTKVPDTITSWVATAFAVNNKTGLGVAPVPANLKVFLDFFVRLDLPYSVVRGEQVVVQAFIFNFFKKNLKVTVSLEKSMAFKNIIVKKNNYGKSTFLLENRKVTRKILVPPGGGIGVNFPIRPEELGNIDIVVRATYGKGGDAIKKQLLVKAEGIPKDYTLSIFIDLRNGGSFSTIRNIMLPDNVVEGSARIHITAVGDLMGPTISDLDNLLNMPYGCGEQNMITLVPNIVVLMYLDTINSLSADIENKAKGFMLVGYQRELTYKHYDGSFSAFGNNDASGSTWLTAFVVKSFAQAKSFIAIDPRVVNHAIDWILDRFVAASGTFSEPGNVIHTAMQGGSATSVRNLAAYVAISLMEAKEARFKGVNKGDFDEVLDRTIEALEDDVPDMEDIYELAIASYALALAGSKKLDDVIDKLEQKATKNDGMMYLEAEQEVDTSTLRWAPPHSQARSRNIEATSYMLLTYAKKKDIITGIKAARWLVQQRNPTGGFGSTQDTVIALQALSNFAALIFSSDFNVNINVTAVPDSLHQFNINPSNALVHQSVDVPSAANSVMVTALGTGIALVEIIVHYNVKEEFEEPMFDMSLSYSDETLFGFKLRVCFRYLGNGTSGMAVMETELLSGFEAKKTTVTDIGILKSIEEDRRKLVLYFDEIPGDRQCLSVRMQRTGMVFGSQPAYVYLYDYYDKQNQVKQPYQPQLLADASVCDINGKALGC